MNYCSHCGQPVSFTIPEGDDRPRYVCGSCGTIHYQNPNIVAGTLATSGSRVLLCKRAIEPRKGYWTLPAGFMENGETTLQAAARETLEEACAEVALDNLYTLINLPHINQVFMIFRARLQGSFHPGPESLEVALFEEHEIPWPFRRSNGPCVTTSPTGLSAISRYMSVISPWKIGSAISEG